MSNPMFRKTPLAAGVAVALGAPALPSVAVAQEGEVIEEIITTGIRGSLRASADIKRAADGVVDAINAEDMGDFPDTNLAESLQRITGVSIERQRGEGGRVTVRGFGPQFNLVTLNGRQMPTAGGVFGAPQGTDRSFDFGDLASEAVSAVEVYKTGRSDVPVGGIGSTINIKTTRPLQDPGLKMSFSASGVYDESRTQRKSTDWTGEVSGIISNTFADDKFGVALTLVRQDREHGGATAQIGGWRSFPGFKHNSWGAGPTNCDSGSAPADVTPFIGQEEWGGIPMPCFAWEGDLQTNRPDATDIYSVPQTIGYNLSDYDRTRTNGQLTLQFRPVETVTATLDYTFSEKEESRTYNDMSAWFNFGGQQTVWPDGDNLTPLEYTEFSSGSDYSMGAGVDAFKNENESLGFNLLWDVSDKLSLALDYHDSTAESGPDSVWGNSALVSIAAYTRDRTSAYFSAGDFPVLQLGLSDPLSPDDMTITGSVFRNDPSKMDIDQLTLSGEMFLDGGFVESIDFGIQLTDVENRTRSAVVQRDAWFANSPLGALEDLMTPARIGESFDEISGSGSEDLFEEFFLWDMAAVVARAEELIAAGDMEIFKPGNLDFGTCGTAFCPSNDFSDDRLTKEESTSAYVQVNMATEFGDMPVGIRAGLRYEQTDVKSSVFYPAYTGLAWVGGNEIGLTNSGETESQNVTSDYDYWLPSLDFRIDLTEDVVARFSYSKTLTRPNFLDIQGGLTITAPVRVNQGSGRVGDPSLKPYESENLDLSAEWYYDDGSYLSVGYFRKDVTNFIGFTSRIETPFDLPHPALGPLVTGPNGALANGVGDSNQWLGWILANLPDEEGVDEVEGIVYGVPGRDPVSPFQLDVPANLDRDVTVDGWELNLQHNFWDTGFGFIANATFVDADVGFNDNDLGGQFVITGLSDSANFVPYWENEDWSVRLAYNWRDSFLAGTGQTNVGQGPPTYVDEYDQWDLSVSYWATDNLQLYTDVINLTNETTYVYGRDYNQVLFTSQLGTRYTLGVRYKF